jgi:uncharacterized protein YciI
MVATPEPWDVAAAPADAARHPAGWQRIMGRVIVAHVAVTNSPDYLTRREPYRKAHIERLLELRGRGILVGGGPSPDGRSAELFYRVARPDQLGPIVEQDPYYREGAWTAYTSRSFQQFVEPWETPPVVLDGSRPVTLLEGPAADPGMAQLALVELRGAKRMAFGGLLDDTGRTLAMLRTADPREATGWLEESGAWTAAELSARPLLYVL